MAYYHMEISPEESVDLASIAAVMAEHVDGVPPGHSNHHDNVSYWIGVMEGEAEANWQCRRELMLKFSEQYPNTLFTLWGEDHKYESKWIEYYMNGRVQGDSRLDWVPAPFDPKKLDDPSHITSRPVPALSYPEDIIALVILDKVVGYYGDEDDNERTNRLLDLIRSDQDPRREPLVQSVLNTSGVRNTIFTLLQNIVSNECGDDNTWTEALVINMSQEQKDALLTIFQNQVVGG